jgi:hypothetical protein
MGDPIDKLAERLQAFKPEEKPFKRNHTIHVDHKSYMLLYSYCRRKGIGIGDVIGDLIRSLLAQLSTKGELTVDDSNKAEELLQKQKEKEDSKKMKSFDSSTETADSNNTQEQKELPFASELDDEDAA